eukprot:9677380-Alexandrium_andersonii.AAC.1
MPREPPYSHCVGGAVPKNVSTQYNASARRVAGKPEPAIVAQHRSKASAVGRPPARCPGRRP